MSYPCYCCGKPTKGKTGFYVVTKDGSDWLPFSDWEKLCNDMGFDSSNPESALGLCGVKWRPETYGSTCYKREKTKAVRKVELNTSKGAKYLFIG